MDYTGVEQTAKEALKHHGILGMKWGVRRTPEELGHETSKPKKERGKSGFVKKDKRNPMYPRYTRDVRTLYSLSNDDFNKILSRLKAEVEYDKIINADYNEATSRRKQDGDFVKQLGKNIITEQVKGAAKWLINTAGQLGTMKLNKVIQKYKEKQEAGKQ